MGITFSSPRHLLASADDHIQEVTQRISRIPYDGEWERVIDTDADTGEQVHKVKYRISIPPLVCVRAFNIVTELRAALDHAVYAASVATGSRAKYTRTAFAFGDDPAAYIAEIDKRCAHVPPDIKTLLYGLNPYPGGDETLWRLNKLRNVKDHRRLLVPLVSIAALKLNGSIAAGPVGGRIAFNLKAPANDEITIMRLPAGATADYNLELAIRVAFGDPEELAGTPVVDFLIMARSAVLKIIEFLETETALLLRRRAT